MKWQFFCLLLGFSDRVYSLYFFFDLSNSSGQLCHIIHIFQQLWLWCFVSGISKRKIYQPGAYKLLQLLCLRPFKDSPIFPPQNRSLYALKIDLVSWKHLLVRLLLSDRMAVQSKWNICHISFWLYIFFGTQPTLGAYNSLILQSLQEEEEKLPFWVIRVIFD